MTRTDCDIIFAQSKQKGKKIIIEKEFEIALGHVAKRMNIPIEKVHAKVLNCVGPVFSGTKVNFLIVRQKKTSFLMIKVIILECIKMEVRQLLISKIWGVFLLTIERRQMSEGS